LGTAFNIFATAFCGIAVDAAMLANPLRNPRRLTSVAASIANSCALKLIFPYFIYLFFQK
jgi:hypothetical protein